MSDTENAVDRIRALVRDDPRYPVEAYLFVFEALRHTLQSLGVRRHVSGRELCHGIREKAIDSFGPLAQCVFRQWGVRRTSDFGDLVFNLIRVGLMGKTDSDKRSDFDDVFDLDEAFAEVELHVTVA